MKCSAGPSFWVFFTVWPNAFSLTFARNVFTTLSSTSASSSDSRTSRSASSVFESVSSAWPERKLRAWRKPLETVSSMRLLYRRGRGRTRHAMLPGHGAGTVLAGALDDAGHRDAEHGRLH